ncbi:MAG: hypothetical protein AMS24_00710 [Chlamydiae bacterium SM23_39]|nr:MAG: hypothetical protein AMS24_00710 [Chlamydiae bacterium SM23_39]
MLDVNIRLTKLEDKEYLIKWLLDEDTLKWYPMSDRREVEHASTIWMSYINKEAVYTAEHNNEPCGCCLLYVSNIKKFAHQALFAIIVAKEHRGKGIGTALIKKLIDVAKDEFKIEILHLEVYEGNPAISLYKRMGFERYGIHKKFIKDKDRYFDKIMMQRSL